MTRILHVVHAYVPDPMGGTERHVQGLATHQVQRGHEVAVVTGTMQWRTRLERSFDRVDGVSVHRIHRDDFHFERWHRAHHPGVSELFAAVLAEARPEVVHVHHWLRLALDLAHCAAAHRIPVVVSLHDSFATCPTIHRVLRDGSLCREGARHEICARCVGQEYPGFEGVDALALEARQALLARELACANRVLTLSRHQTERLQPLLPDLPLVVQPFASFTKLTRSPLPPPPPPLRVATLGHVNPMKGQHLLLQAVRRLPDPRLVQVDVFGEVHPEDYATRLRSLAEGLSVTWHGRYEYPSVVARPLHLIALTSTLPETYGLVLDEAKMLGVPVVASDLGSYPERVGAGGVLVPSEDVAALTAVLQRALEQPGYLTALRAGVSEPPSAARLLDTLDTLYDEVRREGARMAADQGPRIAERAAFARADALERLLARAPTAQPSV